MMIFASTPTPLLRGTLFFSSGSWTLLAPADAWPPHPMAQHFRGPEILTNTCPVLYADIRNDVYSNSGLASCRRCSMMEKHKRNAVLVCTWSTQCKGNGQTSFHRTSVVPTF